MPCTKDVVYHQFRQLIVYTCVFCLFQLIAFSFQLSATWSFLFFLGLLTWSFYEDTVYFDQDSIPENILVLRIWANQAPLYFASCALIILEKGQVLRVLEPKGLKPLQPEQVKLEMVSVGIAFLDHFLNVVVYYLYYFCAFATYRGMIAQFRFVHRLVELNMDWSDDASYNVPVSEPVEAGEDEGNDGTGSRSRVEEGQGQGQEARGEGSWVPPVPMSVPRDTMMSAAAASDDSINEDAEKEDLAEAHSPATPVPVEVEIETLDRASSDSDTRILPSRIPTRIVRRKGQEVANQVLQDAVNWN